MKFLIIGDIEKAGYLNSLSSLKLSDYTFIILTGDMSGSPEGWKIGKARGMEDRSFIPPGKNPKEYYQELLEPSVEKLKEVDENLGKLGIKVFAVYGNTDFKSIVARAKPKNFEIIHNKIVEVNGFYLVGYNGHPMYPWEMKEPLKKDIFGYTHEETSKELNSFREEDVYKDLKTLTENHPSNRVITVTHTPPYKILDKVKLELVKWAVKSYGETAEDGNVGSTGLRKFILEYKPLMSIFGHIHEAKGTDKIDDTHCINAGNFDKEKELVEITLLDSKLNIEFKKLNP